MTDLAAAGRQGHAEEMRKTLHGLYEALAELMRKKEKDTADVQGTSISEELKDTLLRLKVALDQGDEQRADELMAELRATDDLSGQTRELYFFLYNALLMGETEKAAGGLAVWMKYFSYER
jgi:hypothetical protein